MANEVKVECIKCSARYLVEESSVAQLVCPKCNAREFRKVAPVAAQPPAPSHSEVKIECAGCKAHYMVDESAISHVTCPKCGGKKFSKFDGTTAAAKSTNAAPSKTQNINPHTPPTAAAPAKPTPPPPAAAPAKPTPPPPAAAPAKPAPAPASKQAPASAPAKPAAPPPPHKETAPARAPVSSAAMAESVARVQAIHEAIMAQLQRVIVGQQDVIEELITAILGGGHCLLEGVPGLAKTLLISSLAKAMDLSFKRIQFTPDLMPSDITGTEVLQDDPDTGQRMFKFLKGPIFANIVLADEINRTPPKTQAAMLEAMQERQVSIGGVVHKLTLPFFVLATQNPLDQEGTYPLPEAQQDRFIFKIFVDYPPAADEIAVVRRVTEQSFGNIEAVCQGEELLNLQKAIREIPVADAVIDYANRLVRATRIHTPDAPDFTNNWLSWGAGPRATINLVTAARCFCALAGRAAPSCDDVARAAPPVLRHRIALNYVAKAEGLTTDKVITKLIETVRKY